MLQLRLRHFKNLESLSFYLWKVKIEIMHQNDKLENFILSISSVLTKE